MFCPANVFCDFFLFLVAAGRHVNSGGRGGVTPPNVWKMQLELENHSLHLEFACSMRTHF